MFTWPDFDPIAVSFGPLAVRWYGLMYLIGFAGGWWLGRVRARQGLAPVTVEQVDDLVFYIAMGVILGGRIGSVIFYNFDTLLADPLYLLRIWEGGMSFHGGLLGVIFAVYLFGRKHGLSLFQMTDFVAPLVTIGLGAGRVGNFINGELWGKTTDVPWAVIYQGQARHPTQLYEAVLEGLVLFLILWWYSSKPRPLMAVSGMFLLCYGLFRGAVEFVRVPDAHIGYLAFEWLTMGQVLTVPMILGGILLLWLAYRESASKTPAAS